MSSLRGKLWLGVLGSESMVILAPKQEYGTLWGAELREVSSSSL